MYLIYSEGQKNDRIQRIVERAELRDEKVKHFNSDEISREDFFNVLEDDREIDVLLYLGLKGDELRYISKGVKEKVSDVFQVALIDESDHQDIEEMEIDILIAEERTVIDSLFKNIDQELFKEKSRKLRKILFEFEGKMAIFVHDDPDPDAVASAVALEKICRSVDLRCETYYGGEIGHPENEIFMENTNFMIEKVDEDSIKEVLESSENIAFVDFAESAVSDVIPDDLDPDLILDHHSTNKDIKAKRYTEIRTDIGSTSTLMTKHLQNLDIEIPSVLASALLVGIKIDTHDYTKNISPLDFKSIVYLNSIADREILDVLESPPIYSETLTALGRALSNREVEKNVLVTFCGNIKHGDDTSMIADFLLRERDILTVLVFGVKDKKIHMSVRSKDLQLNVGEIMDRAYSDIGEAGGHPHSAGGKTSLGKFENREKAVEMIKKRFYDEVDIR